MIFPVNDSSGLMELHRLTYTPESSTNAGDVLYNLALAFVDFVNTLPEGRKVIPHYMYITNKASCNIAAPCYIKGETVDSNYLMFGSRTSCSANTIGNLSLTISNLSSVSTNGRYNTVHLTDQTQNTAETFADITVNADANCYFDVYTLT